MLKKTAALLFSLALLSPLALQAAPVSRPPIASFFNSPATTEAVLSPDGTHLAIRMLGGNKRYALAVMDLTDSKRSKVVALFEDADVGRFQWVNNKRLVFDSMDRDLAEGDPGHFAPGLFAVDSDGKQFVQLASRKNGEGQLSRDSKLMPATTYMLGQNGLQDSNFFYAVAPIWSGDELESLELLRVDATNGRYTTLPSPGRVVRWMLDHQGAPRLIIRVEKNVETIEYLDPVTKKWDKLAQFDAYLGGEHAFYPLAFAPDGTLYVSAYAGTDHASVYRYDLAKRTLAAAPLVKVEGYDFDGDLVTSADKLLGINLTAEAHMTEWFDPAMKAMQARVDALLPNNVNLLHPPSRSQTPWMLVSSSSDRQPEFYALFNNETGQLKKVAETYPNIDARQMATQRVVSYKARDGLTIPALLTLPAGIPEKQLPLVMLVHGGPYVRGSLWGWSPQTQFLASRGYAVLEPEFRGSEGHGDKHFHAGWKQWGLAMQNDIADGAKWAIAEGIVDPKRICIAGASYGGYATLMGLINDPDLYKCGVDWVGVTDIKLMYTGTWYGGDSDMGPELKKYGMPAMIGDPVKDAAQLNATSPLQQASRIKQPLLLAYGGADQRVPDFHGKKFYDAVKQTNNQVEWVLYREEGHGWRLLETRLDFWGRVEKFLDKQIGKASE
jgi:dienelactone hydrolase